MPTTAYSRLATVRVWTRPFFVAALLAPCLATANQGADPLFLSNDILDVRIEAPFATIMRERPDEEYVPALFQYEDESGAMHSFDIGVRTRGNFRRRVDICRFTPLRLNFRQSQTQNTLFDKQDKLKLVTHCKSNSANYRDTVVREYLAYRVLNLITDMSFRARLLRITYVYTDRDNRERETLAILLESNERLANRTGTAPLKVDRIGRERLDPEYANLISVFHYFIGNTDFSQIATAPGDNCCHNHALFAAEGAPVMSTPYDFDMSGFVNAPHATPNPRFRLRSVRDRLYRGRCSNNRFVAGSVQQFFDERDEIFSLITPTDGKITRSRKGLLRFVDWFYAGLDTPKEVEARLTTKCI